MPLVSVVIPAYNCAAYLEETLGSVLAQAGVELEVIVVNDGSTDETAQIARRFGDPVRVVDQANAGVCAARNHGLRLARGEFIALLDHDDYWLPGKLASQIATFAEHPEVDVVCTRFARWLPDPASGVFPQAATFLPESAAQGIDADRSGWIYHHFLIDSWVLTSTALARGSVMQASGGFDEQLPYGEDWDFWMRMARRSQFIRLLERTTLYRQHPTQGSRALRNFDYRTFLLERAAERWGLCSHDGRCVPRRVFKRQLAKYSTSFGLGHLKGGDGADRRLAARAFVKAWVIDPTYLNSLAWLAAVPFYAVLAGRTAPERIT